MLNEVECKPEYGHLTKKLIQETRNSLSIKIRNRSCRHWTVSKHTRAALETLEIRIVFSRLPLLAYVRLIHLPWTSACQLSSFFSPGAGVSDKQRSKQVRYPVLVLISEATFPPQTKELLVEVRMNIWIFGLKPIGRSDSGSVPLNPPQASAQNDGAASHGRKPVSLRRLQPVWRPTRELAHSSIKSYLLLYPRPPPSPTHILLSPCPPLLPIADQARRGCGAAGNSPMENLNVMLLQVFSLSPFFLCIYTRINSSLFFFRHFI